MRFVRHDPTDCAFRHHLLHGREVARVAPILVHRDDAPLLLGELDQLLGFRERERERLIDKDMMTGAQALLRNRMMGRIGCCYNNKIEGTGQQVVDAANECGFRIARVRLAVTLHDRGQPKSLDRSNDRRMKDLPGEPEPDEPNVKRQSDLRLRHDPQIRLRRLPTLRIDLFRVLV